MFARFFIFRAFTILIISMVLIFLVVGCGKSVTPSLLDKGYLNVSTNTLFFEDKQTNFENLIEKYFLWRNYRIGLPKGFYVDNNEEILILSSVDPEHMKEINELNDYLSKIQAGRGAATFNQGSKIWIEEVTTDMSFELTINKELMTRDFVNTRIHKEFLTAKSGYKAERYGSFGGWNNIVSEIVYILIPEKDDILRIEWIHPQGQKEDEDEFIALVNML